MASKHASMLSESSENAFSVTTLLVSSPSPLPSPLARMMGPSRARTMSPMRMSSGIHRQGVAAAGPALRGHQPSPLQVLENLLEKARRNGLTPRDVFDLRSLATAMKGDVEDGADAIATFVRELHSDILMGSYIGIVKNRSVRDVHTGESLATHVLASGTPSPAHYANIRSAPGPLAAPHIPSDSPL